MPLGRGTDAPSLIIHAMPSGEVAILVVLVLCVTSQVDVNRNHVSDSVSGTTTHGYITETLPPNIGVGCFRHDVIPSAE